jgi:hypothetical protein
MLIVLLVGGVVVQTTHVASAQSALEQEALGDLTLVRATRGFSAATSSLWVRFIFRNDSANVTEPHELTLTSSCVDAPVEPMEPWTRATEIPALTPGEEWAALFDDDFSCRWTIAIDAGPPQEVLPERGSKIVVWDGAM